MKKRTGLVAAMVAAFALVGCSAPATAPETTTAPAPVTTSSDPAPVAVSHSDPIVIYSNSVSDGRGDWLVQRAAQDGFNVQYVSLGGGDLQNRLIAEAANPIADVVFGLNSVYYEKLVAADVLAPYTPAWADKVDPTQGTQSKMYWPIVREPIMLVYNTAAVDADNPAPTDWPDLWTNQNFWNRYEVPTNLGQATTQMVLSGILTRYRDDNGDLGISQAGWDAIASYFKHGNRAVDGTDLYARMASGDILAGQMYLSGKATREAQYDITTNACYPTIGVPMVVQSVAMVKGTKHTDTAEAFIDWFGSGQIQAEWSQQFFTAPTNSDAVAGANQDAISQTDAFSPQDIDWAFVAANIDKWVEKITLNYAG